MRGAEVRWRRQSVQRLHGLAVDAPVSDVFDAELTEWVRDFQRQHQLAVDGIAGVRTQLALAGAVGGPDTPLLSAADTPHGGWSLAFSPQAPQQPRADCPGPMWPTTLRDDGS